MLPLGGVPRPLSSLTWREGQSEACRAVRCSDVHFLQGKGRKLLRPKQQRKTRDFPGGMEPALDSHLVLASPAMFHWRRQRPGGRGWTFWASVSLILHIEAPGDPVAASLMPSEAQGLAGPGEAVSAHLQTREGRGQPGAHWFPGGRFQIGSGLSSGSVPGGTTGRVSRKHRVSAAGSTPRAQNPDSCPRHCQERLGLRWNPRLEGAVSAPAVGPF